MPAQFAGERLAWEEHAGERCIRMPGCMAFIAPSLEIPGLFGQWYRRSIQEQL